jgi:membrane protease subunit (stomatin/prohibitin family)
MAGAMSNAMNQSQKGTQGETAAAAKTACPKCGAGNLANAKFCNECGARMEVAGQAVLCAKCGAQVPAGSKFCNECGTKVEPGS